MKSKPLSLFLLFLIGSWSCENSTVTNKEQSNIRDSLLNAHQSYANFDEVKIDSLHLILHVDFDKEQLAGTASWKILPQESCKVLRLDTRSMDVEKVWVDGKEADFDMTASHEIYGKGLFIPVNSESREVKIAYHTLPEAEALQWMKASQTVSGKPFLYTQSQAILARTWVPCMDVPQVRFTYTADITCDTAYLALMSAVNPAEKSGEGKYSFRMPQRIPSYLLALAVGDIAYQAYDAVCGVYAETAVLEEAYDELRDLPAMIKAAEDLYGPYRWGKYDVLFLPASFPFGGMENPRLTFATPTILAGDRSLVALVAHELAHSWSGNLVTNRSWNDFWLNEGFTVYFEQRIMEAVYGKEYADMLTVLGYNDLMGTLEELGMDDPDTRLYLNLSGRDPDDGVSDIAYEKGRFFLRHLENLVGRERFDRFLRAYFDHFAFGTMTTTTFLEYLKTNLLSENPEWMEQAHLEEWIYSPGLPDGFRAPHSSGFDRVDSLAPLIKAGDVKAIAGTKDWGTHHWLRFIRGMDGPQDTVVLARLEQNFGFSEANSELRDVWFITAVQSDWRSMTPAIREFLVRVGRRKFLTPLYRAMKEGNAYWNEAALSVYKEAREGYHSVSVNTLDELLDYHP